MNQFECQLIDGKIIINASATAGASHSDRLKT